MTRTSAMRQGRHVGRDGARLTPSGLGSHVAPYGGPRVARVIALGDVERGEAQGAEDELGGNAVASMQRDLESKLAGKQRDRELDCDLMEPRTQPVRRSALVDVLNGGKALAVRRADPHLDDGFVDGVEQLVGQR